MGKFIVFEGIDGSGKSTLAKLVTKKLVAAGQNATYNFEPTKTYDEGIEVRQLLEEGATVERMIELFNADREKHQADIKASDGIFICDRYFYSTIAYQCALAHISPDHFSDLGIRTDFIIPDTIYLIDADVYECAGRIRARGAGVQVTEDPIYTRAIRANYEEIFTAQNSIARKAKATLYGWAGAKVVPVENRNGDTCYINTVADSIVADILGT